MIARLRARAFEAALIGYFLALVAAVALAQFRPDLFEAVFA